MAPSRAAADDVAAVRARGSADRRARWRGLPRCVCVCVCVKGGLVGLVQGGPPSFRRTRQPFPSPPSACALQPARAVCSRASEAIRAGAAAAGLADAHCAASLPHFLAPSPPLSPSLPLSLAPPLPRSLPHSVSRGYSEKNGELTSFPHRLPHPLSLHTLTLNATRPCPTGPAARRNTTPHRTTTTTHPPLSSPLAVCRPDPRCMQERQSETELVHGGHGVPASSRAWRARRSTWRGRSKRRCRPGRLRARGQWLRTGRCALARIKCRTGAATPPMANRLDIKRVGCTQGGISSGDAGQNRFGRKSR